jgi:hypothetical protein
MSKIMRKGKTPESNTHHISMVAADIATQIATHAADADAHEDRYTKTEINALLGIGSANSKTVQCILEYDSLNKLEGWVTYRNQDGNDHDLTWGVPLSPTMGALKLYIVSWHIGIFDADASDYVDSVTLFGWQDYNNYSSLASDATNLNSVGDKSYTPGAPIDCSGQIDLRFRMVCVCTTNAELDIAHFYITYYYDT